jgi:UDP-N-acetylglucosamine diphosphorylase/glucosamine-1-phosphate N-acetyltransferase
MRFLLYDDASSAHLFPLTHLRPSFELICGRESLRRRMERWFPTAAWGVHIRADLADVYAEAHPKAHVNDETWCTAEPILVVAGRWLPQNRDLISAADDASAGFVGDELAWILLQPYEFSQLHPDHMAVDLHRIAETRRPVQTGGTMITRPWDLIHNNASQLLCDFEDVGLSQPRHEDHVQILGDERDVYIHQTAQIDPYVVIDARTGPVSIDGDVQIQSFTRLEGPCHIGSGARIFRGVIRAGTTVGESCRIGGEVEESILHACVNKYHEGFLGHSYVCPWVNLGAMTTTSDLKNDYSTVKVPLGGELVDSGLQKVGSFFGDHSKVAIDSMFNTGSSIGVMAMVLPGGRLLPRHIPSFGYVSFGELTTEQDLNSALATADTVMGRRGSRMTGAMETLLRKLHGQTEPERSRAIQRAIQRRLQA